jgi:PIN domain nuclease of toxin-antitoxin system
MDVLLDTCAFLYLCTDDPKLSAGAKRILMNRQNRRFLSVASVWEMAIKANPARNPTKKLELGKPLDVFMSEYLERYEVEVLPLQMEYLVRVSVLQEAHGDPFDRLIIAKGLVLSLSIVTNDPKFDGFGVKTIW